MDAPHVSWDGSKPETQIHIEAYQNKRLFFPFASTGKGLVFI